MKKEKYVWIIINKSLLISISMFVLRKLVGWDYTSFSKLNISIRVLTYPKFMQANNQVGLKMADENYCKTFEWQANFLWVDSLLDLNE